MVHIDFFFVGAGEKHAIDFVAIWSIHQEMLAVECVHQDVPSLIEASKNKVITMEAAALFDTRADGDFQVFRHIDQSLNIGFVLLRLNHKRKIEP